MVWAPQAAQRESAPSPPEAWCLCIPDTTRRSLCASGASRTPQQGWYVADEPVASTRTKPSPSVQMRIPTLGERRHLESRPKAEDWFVKQLQGTGAHPLAASGVVTLCRSSTGGWIGSRTATSRKRAFEGGGLMRTPPRVCLLRDLRAWSYRGRPSLPAAGIKPTGRWSVVGRQAYTGFGLGLGLGLGLERTVS
jgi:hypothetical protein